MGKRKEANAPVYQGQNDEVLYVRPRLVKSQAYITEMTNQSPVALFGLLDGNNEPEPKKRLKPNNVAIERIRNAKTLITMGPGSFYTSLMAVFMTDGVAEALASRKGSGVKRVYIANPTLDFESIGMTLGKQVEAIERYTGKRFSDLFDAIIVNDAELMSKAKILRYGENLRSSAPVHTISEYFKKYPEDIWNRKLYGIQNHIDNYLIAEGDDLQRAEPSMDKYVSAIRNFPELADQIQERYDSLDVYSNMPVEYQQRQASALAGPAKLARGYLEVEPGVLDELREHGVEVYHEAIALTSQKLERSGEIKTAIVYMGLEPLMRQMLSGHVAGILSEPIERDGTRLAILTDQDLLGTDLGNGEILSTEILQRVHVLMGVDDLIKDQRIGEDPDAAAERALGALRTIHKKMRSRGLSWNSISQEQFNQLFGVTPMVVAGGSSSRFSAWVPKVFARGGLESTNIHYAIEGTYSTPGVKPIIFIGEKQLGFILRDEYIDGYDLAKRTFKARQGVIDLRAEHRSQVIGSEYIDPNKVEKYFGTTDIVLGFGGPYGHGDYLAQSVTVINPDLNTAYLQVAFGEAAEAYLPTRSNTSFITYLQILSEDSSAVAGGRAIRPEEDESIKGHFFFNNGSSELIAYRDYDQIPHLQPRYGQPDKDLFATQVGPYLQAAQKVLEASDDPSNKANLVEQVRSQYPQLSISDDGTIFSFELIQKVREEIRNWSSLDDSRKDWIRSHFGVREYADGTAAMLISSNTGIFRTESVRNIVPKIEELFHQGGFPQYMNNPALTPAVNKFWGLDPKDGNWKTLAWHAIELIAGLTENGQRPKMGFAFVGSNAPSSIKNPDAQMRFSKAAMESRNVPRAQIPQIQTQHVPIFEQMKVDLQTLDSKKNADSLERLFLEKTLPHSEFLILLLSLLGNSRSEKWQGALMEALSYLYEGSAKDPSKEILFGLVDVAISEAVDAGWISNDGTDETSDLKERFVSEMNKRGKKDEYLVTAISNLMKELGSRLSGRRELLADLKLADGTMRTIRIAEGGGYTIDITTDPGPTKEDAMRNFIDAYGFKPEEGVYVGNQFQSPNDRDAAVARIKGLHVKAVDENQVGVIEGVDPIGGGVEFTTRYLESLLQLSDEQLPKFIGFDVDDTILGLKPDKSKESLLDDRRRTADAIVALAEKGVKIVFLSDNDSKNTRSRVVDPLMSLYAQRELKTERITFYTSRMITKSVAELSPGQNKVDVTMDMDYSSKYRMSSDVAKALREIIGVVEHVETGVVHATGAVGISYDRAFRLENGQFTFSDLIVQKYPNLSFQTNAKGNPNYVNVDLREMMDDGSLSGISILPVASSASSDNKLEEFEQDERLILINTILSANAFSNTRFSDGKPYMAGARLVTALRSPYYLNAKVVLSFEDGLALVTESLKNVTNIYKIANITLIRHPMHALDPDVTAIRYGLLGEVESQFKPEERNPSIPLRVLIDNPGEGYQALDSQDKPWAAEYKFLINEDGKIALIHKDLVRVVASSALEETLTDLKMAVVPYSTGARFSVSGESDTPVSIQLGDQIVYRDPSTRNFFSKVSTLLNGDAVLAVWFDGEGEPRIFKIMNRGEKTAVVAQVEEVSISEVSQPVGKPYLSAHVFNLKNGNGLTTYWNETRNGIALDVLNESGPESALDVTALVNYLAAQSRPVTDSEYHEKMSFDIAQHLNSFDQARVDLMQLDFEFMVASIRPGSSMYLSGLDRLSNPKMKTYISERIAALSGVLHDAAISLDLFEKDARIPVVIHAGEYANDTEKPDGSLHYSIAAGRGNISAWGNLMRINDETIDLLAGKELIKGGKLEHFDRINDYADALRNGKLGDFFGEGFNQFEFAQFVLGIKSSSFYIIRPIAIEYELINAAMGARLLAASA